MEEEKKKVFTVYTLRMANYLCRKGHDIIGITDEKKDSTKYYKVLFFEDTDELRKDIYEYTKLNSK